MSAQAARASASHTAYESTVSTPRNRHEARVLRTQLHLAYLLAGRRRPSSTPAGMVTRTLSRQHLRTSHRASGSSDTAPDRRNGAVIERPRQTRHGRKNGGLHICLRDEALVAAGGFARTEPGWNADLWSVLGR
jgi:hypothetical protein